MFILGIETSCDDTGASIVNASEEKIEILSNVVAHQNDFHEQYHGVVPEIAARKHVEFMLPTLQKALDDANLTIDQIDVIAVTTHPGLIGSLLVGVQCAKTLSYLHQKPLISVSHLKAHFFSPLMSTAITYPFIGLLVSGGHTLLVVCQSPLDIEVIGTTLDDACGECFDKVAKHYQFGYPGGPTIEKIATQGDETAYLFPQTHFKADKPYCFSFSGLKTAVIHHAEKYRNHIAIQKRTTEPSPSDDQQPLKDLAASFQKTILQNLYDKTIRAAKDFSIDTIGICGGVSANRYLRNLFTQSTDYKTFFPDFSLCTDNAAMIAGLGFHYFNKGMVVENVKELTPVAQSFKKEYIL